MPDSPTVKSPKVIIAGAGLTGLTMAILLEKAGIEYLVLERSSEIQQTLGGAIILSFNVMPLMEQFGVLEQIEAISFPIETTMIYKEDMEVIREINLRSNRKMYVVSLFCKLHPCFFLLPGRCCHCSCLVPCISVVLQLLAYLPRCCCSLRIPSFIPCLPILHYVTPSFFPFQITTATLTLSLCSTSTKQHKKRVPRAHFIFLFFFRLSSPCIYLYPLPPQNQGRLWNTGYSPPSAPCYPVGISPQGKDSRQQVDRVSCPGHRVGHRYLRGQVHLHCRYSHWCRWQ